MKTKKCTRCSIVKPLSEFYAEKRARDGKSSACKVCINKHNTAYRKANWDKVMAQQAKRQNELAEEREARRRPTPSTLRLKRCGRCGNVYEVALFTRNRYTRDGLASICRQCNTKKALLWAKQYPERMRDSANRRRARKAGLPATLTDNQWRQTLRLFEGRCAYCGNPVTDPQRDHLIPVLYGGPYAFGNMLPACPTCNRSKKARPWRAWMEWKGYDAPALENRLTNLEWLASEPT